MLDHKKEEGYVFTDGTQSYHQYNLKLTNKGRTTATSINVVIERAVQLGQQLRAIVVPRPITERNVILQSEEYRFIPLLMIRRKEPAIEICYGRLKLPRQDTTLHLLVTGNNINPIRKRIEYTDSSEDTETRITIK